MTENSEICANCGHSRSLHICDIGGCTHSKIDRGKFGNAKITSVDDWDCDCRKFISPKNGVSSKDTVTVEPVTHSGETISSLIEKTKKVILNGKI